MCPICEKLGAERRADYDAGEELPPEVKQLVTIIYEDYGLALMQCPSCRTHYTYVYHCDNDIFQPTHVSELKRISDDQAAEMLREQKEWRRRRRAEYMRRLRKRRKKPCGRLPDDEGEVVDHLLERKFDSISLSVLDERLPFREKLDDILARLEKKQIIAFSGEPGRANWRYYTTVKILR